jgi:magnesium transporter
MAATELPSLEELTYQTASEHASMRVPTVAPETTAAAVIAGLRGQRFESATHVAVVEDGRLVGVLPMEDLLAAADETTAAEIMDPEPPAVGPGIDQEVAAWHAVRHRESALAVVDEGQRFHGFIPPHRLLAVLLVEHEEDLARIGGYLRGTSSARAASEEPVARRFWHRLPWLLTGLVGAFFAASIVGSFEAQLEENITLAFFLPGIVYLADAVGTQTEALVIRGLSVGVSVQRIVWRELLTGVLVGGALSLVFYPFALWWWDEADVAFAVSLSLLAACSVATAVAMALPWFFQRLGRDPAFGSGPLATVIQDLLSIVIYFGVALAIVD